MFADANGGQLDKIAAGCPVPGCSPGRETINFPWTQYLVPQYAGALVAGTGIYGPPAPASTTYVDKPSGDSSLTCRVFRLVYEIRP